MVRTFCLKTQYSPIIKLGEDYYKICWDYQDMKEAQYTELDGKRVPTGEYLDTPYCTYMYETVHFKPTLEYIKNLIISWYNSEVDNKILSGFVWNDIPIWLSSENLFNYKAAYDLAVQTDGSSLPVTFKFGDTMNPVYHTFETVGDFTDFYVKAITYINACLSEGWAKKDAIDWSVYEIND